MKQKYIKSPVNYAGGKYRLLDRIIPLFPEKIDTFVDLFGGAFNVGINVEAKSIVYNDINKYLSILFVFFQRWELLRINWEIDKIIKDNHLSATNKEAFLEFRKLYNSYPIKERTYKALELFVLSCYSFNYQMRFNSKHEFNSSFGYKASTMNPNIRENLNLFVETIQKKDCLFISQDFRKLSINSNDFVYVDPPYSLGCGVYQDGKRGFSGWAEQDDNDLLKLMDFWDSHGIKWAMSNVFENKGLINEKLISWSEKYNVHHLAMNYSNSNYHRKHFGSTDEVLITNY